MAAARNKRNCVDRDSIPWPRAYESYMLPQSCFAVRYIVIDLQHRLKEDVKTYDVYI
jgi:hypothetical protein